MKIRIIRTVDILLIILLGFSLGCASKGGVKAASGAPEITAVNFLEEKIEVKASGQFTYTIFKPSDPYKVVVQLPGLGAGRFKGKLESKTIGVTEITVSETDSSTKSAMLEILLESPGTEVQPLYGSNTLVIGIKADGEGPFAEDKITVGAERAMPAEVMVAAKETQAQERPQAAGVKDVPSAVSATSINEVGIEYSKAETKLVIKGNGVLIPNVFALRNRVVIDMPEVQMKAALPSTVKPPLKGIRSGVYPDKVRLVVDLAGESDFEAVTVGNSVVITLLAKEPEWDIVSAPAEPGRPGAPAAPFGLGEVYAGQKISLDFQDADITPIFMLLGEVGGYNVVVHPNVKGTITLKLKGVPWDKALDIILKIHSLEKSMEGNILKIAPIAEFARWKDEETKLRDAERMAEPLDQKVIKLNYATADDVQKAIRDTRILSPRGSVTVDKRMNTLIVQDIAEGIEKISELVDIMDVVKPQVMIEAKIVRVNSEYSKELGIRWGGTFIGQNWPPVGGDFSVNTPPASAGAGAAVQGGALGMIIGTANTVRVNLSLSALETTNKARTLSNPKVLTMDNEAANIQQGDSIPVQTATAEGTTTVFVNANLNLSVTPRIAPDGYVQMKIDANNDQADLIFGALGIKRQGIKTNAIVKDGETLVVGGIYTTEDTDVEAGVPYLSKIPILGNLFKTRRKEGPSSTELLILITPKIVGRTS